MGEGSPDRTCEGSGDYRWIHASIKPDPGHKVLGCGDSVYDVTLGDYRFSSSASDYD